MWPPSGSDRIHAPYRENICGHGQAAGTNLVKDVVDGRSTTLMINRQYRLVHKLNPVRSKVQEVSHGYEAWEFFRRSNRELNKTQVMVGHFTAAAVSKHMFGASQLLNEPQSERSP